MMRNAFRLLKLAWHTTTLLLLPVLTFRLWGNLRFLAWAREQAAAASTTQTPLVSVLIPARNEAANIEACVQSLLRQSYPALEIIALDDGSSDGTGEILDRMAAEHPALRVIHASDSLPEGWNGKSYACQRLAEQAAGERLLFTDADTQHTPESVALGVAQAEALGAALLSAFPYQETIGWAEKLLVSFIIDFLPLLGLNFAAIWRAESGSTAANGQYLLARAADYRALGGHAAIARELVDDVALARLFQANGRKIALVAGAEMLACRMYTSSRDVWAGFSKNLLLGMSGSSLNRRASWLALPFAWGFACLFVTPVLLLADRSRRLALLEIGWLVLLRVLANHRLKRPLKHSLDEAMLTHPAGWGVMALALQVLYRRWRSREVLWKGRAYRL